MPITKLVDGKTTAGAGLFYPVKRPDLERTFQISINGAANVTIEVSNDGVNAVPLAVGITASAGYQDDGAWGFVRANVTSITGGSVTVVMGEKA
jgi:hypothetical protein